MSDMRTAGTVSVDRLTKFSGTDLDDLCEATESAITEGGGFGWLKPPPRQVLENYWKGVLLVPERRLVVGRLDGIIAGSAQLSRAPRNNEAQAFAGTLTSAFVAPWARRRGIGRDTRQAYRGRRLGSARTRPTFCPREQTYAHDQTRRTKFGDSPHLGSPPNEAASAGRSMFF